MLALRIQPGIITQRTITVNDDLAYTLILRARRRRRSFELTIKALTLFGPHVIQQSRFTDLKTARAAFETISQHLAQK
ncbi:hypothetical protein [Lactiplantibacillus plajomi]|uniref:Uncharacterized protein n=1 Tax=Lactiplantibacillus plajomi TaxID=1457217 RepID=A0ABV6K500_9LACO|nr:hypothetical protein [Lactiplantibacillus plajomi]